MKIAAKIVLMLTVLAVGLLPTVGILFLLAFENQGFETTMLIPFGITALGICSAVFHGKTLSFYKNLEKDRILKKPNDLFLGLNLGFAAALLLVSLWFIYLIYFRYPSNSSVIEDTYFILFIVVPFFLGSLLFLEVFYMRKKLNKSKQREVLSEIDDIKGNSNIN